MGRGVEGAGELINERPGSDHVKISDYESLQSSDGCQE